MVCILRVLANYCITAAIILNCVAAFCPVTSTIGTFENLPAAAFGVVLDRRSRLYSEDTPQEPDAVLNVPATPAKPEGTSYPIPLPSPILLSGSMGLAIVSTGSIFELSGGHPQFGFAATCATAAIGVPLCFFLFYAAIKKGMAETEEDDKLFLRGK